MFHNFVGYLTFLAAFLWVNKEDIKRLLHQTWERSEYGDSPDASEGKLYRQLDHIWCV